MNMKPSEPAAQPTCTVVGILDDGWHGLSGSARDCLRAAALVIGVERTLQLVRPELAANCELRPLDGALAQCPGWIRDALAAGRSVAVLATGDPLCHGIGSSLIDRLPGLPVAVLPAPSTLQIACARFGKAWQDVTIASCHSQDAGEWTVGATPDHGLYAVLRAIALHRRVFVFTSPANDPARLARALLTAGHGDALHLSVASRLLLPDETLHPRLSAATAATMHFAEPSVVLVERDELPAGPAFGREDDEYLQRTPAKGLITKLEARAVSLAKLRLTAAATVWDIGAGSGVGRPRMRATGAARPRLGDRKECRRCRQRPRQRRPLPHRQLHADRGAGARRPRRLARPGRGVHRRFRRRTRRADPPDPRPPEPGGRLVMNFVTLENLATATAR
jgi:precorrin-6Y C5,15-methyltransferase (decarboxylating)